jgi:hypothetical protein
VTPGPVQPVLLAVALLAVTVALRGIGPQGRAANPVARRLATIYRLVAALLVCRLVIVLVPGATASFVTVALMVLAAWLPLAGLRFAEELVRRHAARWIKLLALVGGAAFSVIALTIGFVWSGPTLVALATFQAIVVALMVMLITANRTGLSQGERATADTFLIALAATIPMALTDFHAIAPGLPVRFGPFAMLLLVLATSRLVDGADAPRKLVRDVLLCLGGGGLAALASEGSPSAAAFGTALSALALLVERFARSRRGTEGLVRALARADPRDPAALLASHPLLATGRVIEGEALAAWPQATVSTLAAMPVVSDSSVDPDLRDAARDLLDSLAATHLVRLPGDQPRFLAVSAGSFAGPRLGDELILLSRLLERSA